MRRFVILFACSLRMTGSALTQPQSAIEGNVLDHETGVGIRRAVVTATGRSTASVSGITDDNGHFVIPGLSAGTYTVTASKPAFVPARYGSKGPGWPGLPISLKAGERAVGVRIAIYKGAVIAGRIADTAGEPVQNVEVFAIQAQRRSVGSTIASVFTDDRGDYRIYGLKPGSYLVAVVPKLGRSSQVAMVSKSYVDQIFEALRMGRLGQSVSRPAPPKQARFCPIFYPSTVSVDQAVAVDAGLAVEQSGIDIRIDLIPVASVNGSVIGVDGLPYSDVRVSMISSDRTLPFSANSRPEPLALNLFKGAFSFSGVAPGSYAVRARSATRILTTESSSTVRRVTSPQFYWGVSSIVVQGADVDGVVVRLQPALSVSGRFEQTADMTSTSPARLALTPMTNSEDLRNALAEPVTANVAAEGRFELRGLMPGTYTLSATLPGGRVLLSAMSGGRDLLDDGLALDDIGITDLMITTAVALPQLAGALTNRDGTPQSDCLILAFPESESLRESRRRVQVTRPSTEGHFLFTELPPGTYFVAAVTTAEEEEWRNVEFLRTAASAALKVTLTEGQKTIQNLRLSDQR